MNRPLNRSILHMSLLMTFIVISLLQGACVKDRDLSEPEITWKQPAVQSRYAVTDTVDVDVTVTDENQLVSIRMSIVNELLVAVTPSVQVTPETNTYHMVTTMPLDNIHLASGTYFVEAVAENGVVFHEKLIVR